MKTKINSGLGAYTDAQLENYGLAIAAAMTGNAHFTEPQPTLETLNASIKAFSDALALAQSRDKVKVVIKNNMRAALELTLQHLAVYCQFVAKGDREMLVSSGFNVTAETRLAKTLSNPGNFTAELGKQPGEVVLSADTVSNAKAYLFLYNVAPVEDEQWKHVTNSAPYYTLTGLTPGKEYSFKIGILGSRGQIVYTDSITRKMLQ